MNIEQLQKQALLALKRSREPLPLYQLQQDIERRVGVKIPRPQLEQAMMRLHSRHGKVARITFRGRLCYRPLLQSEQGRPGPRKAVARERQRNAAFV